MVMNTTFESSAAYQQALDRTVPSNWASQLRADLNELQRLRAAHLAAPPTVADPDKIAAMQARGRHAGTTKVERKRAAVAAVVGDNMQVVVKWDRSRRSRAEWLKRVMDDDAPAVGWRYIDNYLKTLSL